MEFRDYLQTYKRRMEEVSELFEKKELSVSYDNLKRKKKTNNELLYFKDNGDEKTGIFIFGFDFFSRELSEQEFKKILGQNSINFKIYKAYNDLKKKQKKVKVSDILNEIQDESKDSQVVHKYLRRILTLAYYLNWRIIKDKKDIEQDKYIEINNGYLLKVQQRYNFDVKIAVYENDDLFMFMNSRGKLNIVFKDIDSFTKQDIEKKIFPILKKVFKLGKVSVAKN